MIEIIVDGEKITGKDELHELFREHLSLPEYYGNNLDALYDVLSTYFTPVEITVLNREQLCENIPFYGERFLQVLDIAAQENESCITIKTEKNDVEEELW